MRIAFDCGEVHLVEEEVIHVFLYAVDEVLSLGKLNLEWTVENVRAKCVKSRSLECCRGDESTKGDVNQNRN